MAEKSVTEALQGKTVGIEDVSKYKSLQYPKETKEEGDQFHGVSPFDPGKKISG
ncbi:MAG: hypothetical protein GY799_06195 [Desulfobulbaceae bacterium]|nr:hypothetical protein [Desulfobulbaceae bacterium]